jgi:hypothetical protein
VAEVIVAKRYFAYGQRILSDFEVPGAIDDDSPIPPDIIIRRLASQAMCKSTNRELWRDGATLRFEPNNVAAYHCIAPDLIEITPCPNADEDTINALLIATALPGLLWLRGGFILHASAAIMPGQERVVAVAGPSKQGKSAVLAELVAHGARIVADDSVYLRAIEDVVFASGLPGGYFSHSPDPAARPFVAVGSPSAILEAPLGVVLLLSRHFHDQPATFSPLASMDALSAILSNRHRPAIPALLGEHARRLSDAVNVARTPTYRWSRPNGSVALTAAERKRIVQLGFIA